MANVGLQLNLAADLKNNFTFGSQLTYIGTAGLENNLVGNTRIDFGQSTNANLTTQIMLTKIFVAKKVGNTTVKMGRQELPKSLSPLAFSEGWSVFKNTFDAILAINTDLPKTTLVGAYVSQSNNVHTNFNTMTNLTTATDGAYMLTAQTKAIPMTTVTASYYTLKHVTAAGGKGVDAIWLDAKISPMKALTVAAQYGSLNPELSTAKTTKAWGAKVGYKVGAISASLAYSDVNDGALNVMNYGTGKKTPLYTQMVYNQDALMNEASAIVGKVVYGMGDMGKVILAYGDMSDDRKTAGAVKYDSTEFDLLYKVKAGGVNYLAAYIKRDMDNQGDLGSTGANEHSSDIIRVVARYNF
jgi:hypothetical protein